MTDRARLTVEQVEEWLDGMLRSIPGETQDLAEVERLRDFFGALCDHALCDLRREGAVKRDLAANIMHTGHTIESLNAAPDGGLSGEQIERIKAAAASYELEHGNVGPLRNWWSDVQTLCDMALRSLERPACRVVPEEPTPEMIQAMEDRQIEGATYIAEDSIQYALWKEVYKAMLAAAPPAKHPSGGAK